MLPRRAAPPIFRGRIPPTESMPQRNRLIAAYIPHHARLTTRAADTLRQSLPSAQPSRIDRHEHQEATASNRGTHRRQNSARRPLAEGRAAMHRTNTAVADEAVRRQSDATLQQMPRADAERLRERPIESVPRTKVDIRVPPNERALENVSTRVLSQHRESGSAVVIPVWRVDETNRCRTECVSARLDSVVSGRDRSKWVYPDLASRLVVLIAATAATARKVGHMA